MRIIDLVNPPVVGRPYSKTIRIRKTGKAHNIIRRVLVAPECGFGIVNHIF